MPLNPSSRKKNTRNPARPCKYYQFGQIVKETNRQKNTRTSPEHQRIAFSFNWNTNSCVPMYLFQFQTIGTKLCVWFQVRPLRNGASSQVGCQSKAKMGSRCHSHFRNRTVHKLIHMQKIFIEVTTNLIKSFWTVFLLFEIIFVHYSTFLQLFTRLEYFRLRKRDSAFGSLNSYNYQRTWKVYSGWLQRDVLMNAKGRKSAC